MEEQFTKYETARIIGARALQIAMDAPLLVKLSKEELESLRYDPIKIAEIELNSDVLPITVKRPLPRKIEGKLKREEAKEDLEKLEKKKIAKEMEEEAKVREEGEIMEIARPEDEVEEVEGKEEKAVEE
ncbi:MAG: DNA-directed RNA polymerase subunit K [archaeon]